MTDRFGTDNWSLLVPDGWRAWHEDECATLLADAEIGALQISAAFKATDVLDEDLREFAARHLEAGAIAKPVQAGDFTGFAIAFGDEERFWRQWFLRHGRLALFVTYNCDPGVRGVEDAAVDAILASLADGGAEGRGGGR